MTQAFAPCPSCSRHVKTSEASCPFCKSSLAAGSLVAIPGLAGGGTQKRLTRAAAYAFTASLAVAGCTSGIAPAGDGGSDGAVPEGGAGDGGRNDGSIQDEGGIAPPYGAPAYGQPPPFDSGKTD